LKSYIYLSAFKICTNSRKKEIFLDAKWGGEIKMSNYSAYGDIALGNRTLSARVERTLDQLSSNPTASISSACNDPHQAKAVYRLLSNEKFTASAVLEVSQKETMRRISESGERVVLMPQDTTTLNYSGLRATKGLGNTCDNKNSLGILLHSSIAVSENSQPFGLLTEKAWVRPPEELGKRQKRKELPIEEKESYKWLETLDNVHIAKKLEHVHFIHVCDREGDLYELFAKAQLEEVTYLCRRVQNRIVINNNEEELAINNYLDALPVAGEITVDVPRDSHTKREARTAKFEIKCGTVLIKKPSTLKKSKNMPLSVEVSLVSAQEIDVPDGEDAISWQLITNDSVETFEEAVTCVKRYMQRWKIEVFHHVLKSGCAIEKAQENTAEKLIKLIALYSVIALDIMILTHLARTNPDASCEIFFEADEWKILYKVAKKTKSVPDNPPSIREAVFMMAKLGGFLGRKSDGFPGVVTIWRGLIKFHTIIDASTYFI
jgi:hypothetical protein